MRLFGPVRFSTVGIGAAADDYSTTLCPSDGGSSGTSHERFDAFSEWYRPLGVAGPGLEALAVPPA